MTQLVQEEHVVALAPYQQRLSAPTGYRPGLDEWKEESLRVDAQDNGADRRARRSRAAPDGSDHVDVRQTIAGAIIDIAQCWPACANRLVEGSRGLLMQRTTVAGEIQAHAAGRVHKQNVTVAVGVTDGSEIRPRLIGGGPLRAAGQEACQALSQGGIVRDDRGIAEALRAPPDDPLDLELRDSLEIGLGPRVQAPPLVLVEPQAGQQQTEQRYRERQPRRESQARSGGSGRQTAGRTVAASPVNVRARRRRVSRRHAETVPFTATLRLAPSAVNAGAASGG